MRCTASVHATLWPRSSVRAANCSAVPCMPCNHVPLLLIKHVQHAHTLAHQPFAPPWYAHACTWPCSHAALLELVKESTPSVEEAEDAIGILGSPHPHTNQKHPSRTRTQAPGSSSNLNAPLSEEQLALDASMDSHFTYIQVWRGWVGCVQAMWPAHVPSSAYGHSIRLTRHTTAPFLGACIRLMATCCRSVDAFSGCVACSSPRGRCTVARAACGCLTRVA